MPIKKHVVKIQEKNILEIPKTIADAVGLGEGSIARVYSCGDGYSFKVETVPSYEAISTLEHYKEANAQLRERIALLEKENDELKTRRDS